MVARKILADHCVHQDLIDALKRNGLYVVTARSEKMDKAADTEIFKHTQKYGFILLTFDKDFGNIIRFDIRGSHGVVLIVMETMTREETAHKVCRFFQRMENKKLSGHLYLIERAGVRIWPR